jgi:hypothetical protein
LKEEAEKLTRNALLLKENPLYVLSPYVELSQNVTKTNDEWEEENWFNCDGCGNVLSTPYDISIGIPPSPLIIMTYKSESFDYEKSIKFDETIAQIKSVAKRFDIDSKCQWIFSEQNIMSSKTRICADCQKKYKWGQWRGFDMHIINMQRVCFAVKEYQRRHTPISTAKSDYEKYILSFSHKQICIKLFCCK